MKFKIDLMLNPRNLQDRKSSSPYLSSDTYYEICDYKINSKKDFDALLRNQKDFDRVYIKGHLVNQFKSFISTMKPNSIKVLIIMESDNIQYAHELVPILIIAKVIYSNNLVGKADGILPLPLGLERQCYRSAGVLRDFKKPYELDVSKRKIGFLVAWNDKTNVDRSKYRAQFRESKNSLVINSRVSPHIIHKLMRNTLFVPSPAGNGLDCHRTWEAMYLGAVPVVLEKDFCGDASWPVLVVPSWNFLIEKEIRELKQLYKESCVTSEKALRFSSQQINSLSIS
jgi:hypothetical protein